MATLKEVEREIKNDIRQFISVAANRLTGEVSVQLHSDILSRVFTDGINSSGAPIGTYSKSTVNIKQKKGRFTSNRINLRDTDTLAGSFITLPTSSGYGIGFADVKRPDSNVRNGELAAELEERYGDLFDPTQGELKRIDKIIDNFIDRATK